MLMDRYNITGVERPDEDDEEYFQQMGDVNASKRKSGHRHKQPKDDCSRPENEDKPHCVFKDLPRFYNKSSPSRSNQPLTPLGFTQFYLPDVDTHSTTPPDWVVEYATFKPRHLFPNMSESTQPPPVPFHLLPDYTPGLEEATAEERETYMKKLKKVTPWKMKDLTIGSYIKLARKLVIEKKLWNKFTEYM